MQVRAEGHIRRVLFTNAINTRILKFPVYLASKDANANMRGPLPLSSYRFHSHTLHGRRNLRKGTLVLVVLAISLPGGSHLADFLSRILANVEPMSIP